MSEQVIQAVVIAAGLGLSFAYYPQAWRIWTTKTSAGVSVISYLLFGVGTTIWFLYGVHQQNFPIIISYVFGAIGSWLVLFLTIHYRSKSK